MSEIIKVEYHNDDWMTISAFLSSKINMENNWSDFSKVLVPILQKAFDEGRQFQRKHKDL